MLFTLARSHNKISLETLEQNKTEKCRVVVRGRKKRERENKINDNNLPLLSLSLSFSHTRAPLHMTFEN